MILGFLLTALYWPGIAGAATTPRWGLLAVGLPLLLLRRSADSKLTLIHLFGALFILWSATSLIWSSNRLDGLNELIKLLILTQAFVLGSRCKTIRSMLVGMAIGLLPSSLLVLIEPWNPELVLHTTTHAGLFINSGSLAEISSLVLVGLLANGRGRADCPREPDDRNVGGNHLPLRRISDRIRFWLGSYVPHIGGWAYIALLAALLPCVILPQSRGAWLGLVAAGIFWLWSKSKLSALILVALTAICITYSFSIGYHISSVTQRWGLWTDAISGMTWVGHGIGSFWTDYAPLSNTLDIFIERPEHLHNDWLEVVFEGGIVGFALLFGCAAIICRASGVERAILVAFGAEAAVGFPLHVPATAFLAALCLGHVARDGADIRDVFNVRRIRTSEWLHSYRDAKAHRVIA